MLIKDLEYIPRTYYLIADRPLRIDESTIRLYRDDRIGTNSVATSALPGVARVDPTSPDTTAQMQGQFNILTPGEDYSIIHPWLTQSTGFVIPVIQLRTRLSETDVLGVVYSYKDNNGATVQVGSTSDPTQLLLKLIKVPTNELARGTDGRFDPSGRFYPTLSYELRNFYDLQGRDISFETLSLKVRRIDTSGAVDPEAAVLVGGGRFAAGARRI